MEPIEVDPIEVIQKKADAKGRVTIGAEYANKQLVVAVVEEQE